MFERFSERARRVIFFARYEASHHGGLTIEVEHLLLGCLREDSLLVPIGRVIAEEMIASLPVREKVATSVDLPLSYECMRIITFAAEEADRLNHRQVHTEHLLIGVLREGKSNAARLLEKHGIMLDAARTKLAASLLPEDRAPGFVVHGGVDKQEMLLHMLATLAYRVRKALRDAPAGFENFRAAPQVRTPHELVRHMINVLRYARGRALGATVPVYAARDFVGDVKVFHETLQDLKTDVSLPLAFGEVTPEQLLQGPLSDAMTHAGQLALLRRLAGSPVPPENFIKARIDAENLGPEQPPPVSLDQDWPEQPL